MGGGLLLGLSAVFLLNLTGLERAIVILVSAMPSAVNSVIFATETHLDEDLVASIVASPFASASPFSPGCPSFPCFCSADHSHGPSQLARISSGRVVCLISHCTRCRNSPFHFQGQPGRSSIARNFLTRPTRARLDALLPQASTF